MEPAGPFAEKRQLERSAVLVMTEKKQKQQQRSGWLLGVLLAIPLLILGFVLLAGSRGLGGCWRLQAAAADEVAVTEFSRRDDTAASASAEVLECFQVAQPVLLPEGATTSDGLTVSSSQGTGSSCTVTLMDHVFAYSYGVPFVGEFVPPDCAFNRVVMNFTVVSEGRQYDRLAVMYLNDTEVWRTSTAEPVTAPGIRWVYLKDMTEYLSLWKSPQKIIFDLGNIVNDVYTASFNTTLTATFFMADVDVGAAPPSDLIIPISARGSADNTGSMFTLPSSNATNTVSFPRNANRAVFAVSANGQANEEFWWSDVLQSDALAFSDTAGQLPGYSPFREVQVYIDGQLAGVQWPFPVIFTGGVVPGLHRPIVGLDDFDLREHEIDITPWLPVLCDGNDHTFTIQVAGLADDGATTASLTQTVGSSWYVTGKIFVWLDADADAVTNGTAPVVTSAPPTIRVSQQVVVDDAGANETLYYTVSVARSFSVQGYVASQNAAGAAAWSQTLAYTNDGVVGAYGYDQVNNLSMTGSDAATVAGQAVYSTTYSFPLFCNTTYGVSSAGNITLWAALDQGLALQVVGAAVFPTGLEAFAASNSSNSYPGGSVLSTRFNGTASFFEWADYSYSTGFGSSSQTFSFGGIGEASEQTLYTRDVTAVNATVVQDSEYIAGVSTSGSSKTLSLTAVAPARLEGALEVYAQAPLNGGTGPRVFLSRNDIGSQ